MNLARASVAIPRPVRRLFTYSIPDDLLSRCRPGVRVVVPFGRHRLTGYLLEILDASVPGVPEDRLKRVEEVLDAEPVLDKLLLELTRWAADYYLVSWGEMIRAALPGMTARLRQELSITGPGRALLKKSGPALPGLLPPATRGRARHDILAVVDQFSHGAGGGIRLADLKRRLGPRFRPAALSALVNQGLVSSSEVAVAPGPRPRTEEVAVLVDPAPVPDEPRGPTQRALLSELRQGSGRMEVRGLLRRAHAGRPALRALLDHGRILLVSRETPRQPLALQMPADAEEALDPTPDQVAAIDAITGKIASGRFSTCLLQGVTGSGKTEVYLRAIEAAMATGRHALYLVPEIGLTPLLARRLRRRFGEVLALLHSGLSEGERFDEWRRVRGGQVKVVLGTRSAVFAPLARVGLIVVDEEHDASYKQDEYPRYNGRDLAILRGKMSQAVVVLGSATPSMETFHRATTDRYLHLHLPRRIGAAGLPAVERVDMRREFQETGGETVLSRRLLAGLKACLRRGEQSLVLLNRRGFSTFVLCRSCGTQVQCRRCSIAMTHHRHQGQLRCHYCDDRRPVPETCPGCGSRHLHFGGTGTERLEERLREHLPTARMARMDRDTVSTRGAAESLLTRVERGDIDILLGTQMIAKGHDFPNVTLVGVLAADALLGLPDFRAAERTFQLLLQVAGRSGRRERGGEVIVQAYYADHHAIRTACEHDFASFAAAEREYRRVMHYPPYSSLALLLTRDRQFDRAWSAAQALAGILRALQRPSVQVLGPAPAPLERLRGQYRVQILLKSSSRRDIHASLGEALEEAERRRLRPQGLVVDVDPISTM